MVLELIIEYCPDIIAPIAAKLPTGRDVTALATVSNVCRKYARAEMNLYKTRHKWHYAYKKARRCLYKKTILELLSRSNIINKLIAEENLANFALDFRSKSIDIEHVDIIYTIVMAVQRRLETRVERILISMLTNRMLLIKLKWGCRGDYADFLKSITYNDSIWCNAICSRMIYISPRIRSDEKFLEWLHKSESEICWICLCILQAVNALK